MMPSRFKWHHGMRLIATLILLDQMVGPLSSLPDDPAIVIGAIGMLMAPVPAERAVEKEAK